MHLHWFYVQKCTHTSLEVNEWTAKLAPCIWPIFASKAACSHCAAPADPTLIFSAFGQRIIGAFGRIISLQNMFLMTPMFWGHLHHWSGTAFLCQFLRFFTAPNVQSEITLNYIVRDKQIEPKFNCRKVYQSQLLWKLWNSIDHFNRSHPILRH